jgi:hypothetical protein
MTDTVASPSSGHWVHEDPDLRSAMPDQPRLTPATPDHLISLLEVYAAQYASYTTLLWQVPALSLTAQAFLLTIALSHGNGTSAKVTGAALSAVISAASYALMHDQRGHANCYGELSRRVSACLDLGRYLGGALTVDHVEGAETDAEAVWIWRGRGEVVVPRAGRMYSVWKGCMLIFLFVDIGIIASVVLPLGAAVGAAALLAALSIAVIVVRTRRSEAEDRHCLSSKERNATIGQEVSRDP